MPGFDGQGLDMFSFCLFSLTHTEFFKYGNTVSAVTMIVVETCKSDRVRNRKNFGCSLLVTFTLSSNFQISIYLTKSLSVYAIGKYSKLPASNFFYYPYLLFYFLYVIDDCHESLSYAIISFRTEVKTKTGIKSAWPDYLV